jgi:hypothetical protein
MKEVSVKLGFLGHNYQMALSTIADQSRVLKASASYLLTTVIDESKKHIDKYDGIRKGLIEKYGKKDESGNPVLNEDGSQYLLEDTDSFMKEYEELASLEVTLPELPLSYLQDIRIPQEQMKALVLTILNPEA